MQEELKALTEGKAEAEKKADTAEAEFAKFKANIVTAERTRRVDSLVASGRLQPSEREKVLKMAESLGASTASFAAADGKAVSVEEQYLRDLEGREASELFSEFSKPAGVGGENTGVSANKIVSKL